MADSDGFYWLAFSKFSGVGPVTFQKLLRNFGSARDAWEASLVDLKPVLGEKLLRQFDLFRASFSPDNYVRILLKKGVSFITSQDKQYPQLLKQIQKPPFVLYVRGKKEILNQAFEAVSPQAESVQDDKVVAIVGTRKITQYGREVTTLFTEELVANGFTIVSGLAMGVDAVAHATAVQNNGKTIAVLGCGVDCCTPEENTYLYDQILESGGCVVSELPLGHPPTVGSFPARNRIIAGLSQGVLVTEGAEDSGALITAEYAFKSNRKVFAVPGPITSGLSKGPHKLLSKGAKMVTSGEDIVKELGIMNHESGIKKKRKIKADTVEEAIILKLLENESLHFDEIVKRTGLDSSKIGSLLSLMEIKGMIKSQSSGTFSIAT